MRIGRLISAEQTGADRTALDAALARNIRCGGWVPKGRTADHAPAELRGTAFGVIDLVRGIVLLVASVLVGALWSNIGPQATFVTEPARRRSPRVLAAREIR